MKRVSRPFMFTGLLISLLSYLGSLAICAFLVITYLSIGASAETNFMDSILIIIIGVYAIIMIFALLGLIFSAVSLSRCNLAPTSFYEKKGIVIATLVFNILVTILFIISLFSAFNVVTLVILLLFVVSTIFIIVDLARNKKLLEAEDKEKEEIKNETSPNKTESETKVEE